MTAVLLAFSFASSQNVLSVESSVAGEAAQVDSALVGRDIMSALPEDVVVRQSAAVRKALGDKVESDAQRTMSGYRIRLFLDSSRSAREASLEVMSRFHGRYPNIPVYRTFSAPNYKVSVGSFRTRVEAEKLLRVLKPDFPDAFIVRDRFRYPMLGSPDLSGAAVEMEGSDD